MDNDNDTTKKNDDNNTNSEPTNTNKSVVIVLYCSENATKMFQQLKDKLNKWCRPINKSSCKSQILNNQKSQ